MTSSNSGLDGPESACRCGKFIFESTLCNYPRAIFANASKTPTQKCAQTCDVNCNNNYGIIRYQLIRFWVLRKMLIIFFYCFSYRWKCVRFSFECESSSIRMHCECELCVSTNTPLFSLSIIVHMKIANKLQTNTSDIFSYNHCPPAHFPNGIDYMYDI